MVQAHTLNLACYAIELKSMFLAHTDRAHAKLRACLVNNLVPTVQACYKVVEERILWRPCLRFLQGQGQSDIAILWHVGMSCNLHIAFRIYKRHLHGQPLLACSGHSCLDIYDSLFLRQRYRTRKRLPRINVLTASHNKLYRTEESCSRIPSAALLNILKVDIYCVLALAQQIGDIKPEGVVAVWPISRIASVHHHPGLSHGAIEAQQCMFRNFVYRYCSAIVALANPWQRARASGLLCFLFLSILLNGDILQVPFLVEWSCYSPVMRYSHALPFHAVT